MKRRTTHLLLCLGLVAALAPGCAGEELAPAPPRARPTETSFEPGPRVMQRLTREQYANAIHDLFGDDIVIPTQLEPDTDVDGFFSIGAATASVSTRGVEQYERAAYAIAAQVTTEERRSRLSGCVPASASDSACARTLLAPLARRAWRRPPTSEELDTLARISSEAGFVVDSFYGGLEYGLAAILTSPFYLYRPQVGVPDAGGGETGRLDAYELATRLAFFLWNTLPDEALLEAAERGSLEDHDGLAREVERLLSHPNARRGVRAFTAEWLELHRLDFVIKDTTIFPDAAPALFPAAREQTLRTVERHVFDLNGDFRDLLTSRETFVDRRLAALYNVRAPEAEGFGLVTLPADSPRRGLLGHASVLSTWSHSTSTSPTLRGHFVRRTLLCQTTGAPPVGVDTAIPEPSAEALTLRERLEEHRSNAFCATCHDLLDPIGLGLEHFDGVGRFRVTDEGAAIDASGELDGAHFADLSELAVAMRSHPALVPCFVERTMGYALGHSITEGERAAHYELTTGFALDGFTVRALLREIASSDAFVRVSMREGE